MRLFITLEGIDGSGKSTVAKYLKEKLDNDGIDVVLTWEPTNTWLGECVKRGYNEGVNVFTELYLFMADRASHVQRIKKNLDDEKVVISDRYAESTFAYQGTVISKKMNWCYEKTLNWMLSSHSPFLIEPNITILLDAPAKICLSRLKNRDGLTKFEVLEYLEDVRNFYIFLADKYDRIKVLNAEKDIDSVCNDAYNLIKKLF